MIDEAAAKKVIAGVDRGRLIALASRLLSIPSWDLRGQEEVAEYCLAYMEALGMKAQLQEVKVIEESSTKQAVGRFMGSGDGPSLLLCSHLDTGRPYRPNLWTKRLGQVEDGWVYGVGGQKCGLAAMLEAARVVNTTVRLKGDLIVAGVACEAIGGYGIEHLLQSEVKPDMAIVGEDTDLQLCTLSVAGIFGTLRITGRPDRPKGVGGVNPEKKMLELLQELKPFVPATPGGWLTFQPNPELPGYPRLNVFFPAQQEPYNFAVDFDCRIVPGQSEETVRSDLERLLKKVKARDPDLSVELTLPNRPLPGRLPFQVAAEERIVQTVARWHEYVTGVKPFIGAGIRVGFASDANNLMAAGVPCVNYGPGDFQEPVNERKKVEDVVKAAKVYALSALEICA